MGSPDFGPAQPIADAIVPKIHWLAKMLGYDQAQTPAPAQPDPSWHSSMVQQANDSFRKQAEQPVAPMPPMPPKRKPMPR